MTRAVRIAGDESRRGIGRRVADAATVEAGTPAGPDSTMTPPAFACAA